jgi:uncharacterized protein YqjF (DUF2071 family)
MRKRPAGRAAMLQSWRDLLFLHFSVDPDQLQKLLPRELSVDTFPDAEGLDRAWIGLVPFRMKGIRPAYAPALPWISAFPETNVRTYVHRDGQQPGVWFFSLDAARWLACRFARSRFALPYFHASMSATRQGSNLRYQSDRKEAPAAALEIEATVGEALPQPEPASLEFFLVERYLLYSQRDGSIYSGRVSHAPYPLYSASVRSCRQTVVKSNGLDCADWEHVCFSEGVDVEVFSLRPT